MTLPTIRYRTNSRLITTIWAAIYRSLADRKYFALACRLDPEDPALPEIHMVTGATPAKAYVNLVRRTGRPWWIVMREADLLEMDPTQWRALVRTTPQLRLVSEVLWRRAELIWQSAPDNPERSRGLWLVLTAAHGDEIVVNPGA